MPKEKGPANRGKVVKFDPSRGKVVYLKDERRKRSRIKSGEGPEEHRERPQEKRILTLGQIKRLKYLERDSRASGRHFSWGAEPGVFEVWFSKGRQTGSGHFIYKKTIMKDREGISVGMIKSVPYKTSTPPKILKSREIQAGIGDVDELFKREINRTIRNMKKYYGFRTRPPK